MSEAHANGASRWSILGAMPIAARILGGIMALGAFTASADARADMPTPIDALGPNVADAFTGTNLFYYGGAIASTGILVGSGGDHAIRRAFQLHLHSDAYGDIAYYTGYIAPVVIAPGIYVLGLALRDRTLAGAGAATTQALAVTLLATGILKVGTGRVFPNNGGDPKDPRRLDHDEYARDWAPFGLAGRYAWPSGHTSSTVSIAAALSAYYDDVPWMPFVTYPIALAVGIGMLDGDHHWASDVLAGGLIGQAVGWSIGRDFRHLVREGDTPNEEGAARVHFAPLLGLSTIGLTMTGEL